MLSQLASNLQKEKKSLVLTPTRLEDNFKKNKDFERDTKN